jgi:hypothetical protein
MTHSVRLVAILRYWLVAPNIAWRILSPRAALIPPQIKDYGLGIPACLANVSTESIGFSYIPLLSQITGKLG